MSETDNAIIREHGNMLDVSINGKFQTVQNVPVVNV